VAIDPRIYEGLADFRYALRRFSAASEAITDAAGVTSQQYQALLVIRTSPSDGIMIRDLADQMLLKHHSAVQLVDRLARAGLIERNPSPTDGRSVLVSMTQKGEELFDRLAADHIQELMRQEHLLAGSLYQLRHLDRQRKVRLG
jgi:DNA-binding MarR family transcriptional regulator